MTTSNAAPMVSVPVEPTDAMLRAFVEFALSVRLDKDYRWHQYGRGAWARMIAAAPAPQPVQKMLGSPAYPDAATDPFNALLGSPQPVLWVNADALANERHIGINAVRADHQDRRHYTVPLYAQPPAPAVGDGAWKDAVLDALANTCMDAPMDEPPTSILARVISWHVMVATDPTIAALVDVERRAKSLLYAEYAQPWFSGNYEDAAIDAIAAALRSQGQAGATELRGIRDTLIVAANNPLSHGGIRGLREIMLTQARRITAAIAQQGQADAVGGVKFSDAERKAWFGLLANLEHDAGDVEDSPPSIAQDEDAYWAYHGYHALRKAGAAIKQSPRHD